MGEVRRDKSDRQVAEGGRGGRGRGEKERDAGEREAGRHR